MDICPKPLRWHAIYKSQLDACEKEAIASKPPVPLILNGWVYSNDVEKAERWNATKDWAERNRISELVTFPPEDWYSVEETSSCAIGPLGSPVYFPWRFEPASRPSVAEVRAALTRLTDNWAQIAGDLFQPEFRS